MVEFCFSDAERDSLISQGLLDDSFVTTDNNSFFDSVSFIFQSKYPY